MKYTFKKFYQSDAGASGGSSGNGPTLEQLLQQLSKLQSDYSALQTRIQNGELVEPNPWLKTKVDAGELYPKERYVGLQQTLQQEKDARKAEAEALAALKTQLEEATQKLTGLETEKSSLSTEAEQLRKRTKRTELIASKYPQLLSFEFPGEGLASLLPTAPDDQLEAVLGKFASKIGDNTEKAKEEFGKGGGSSTPPPVEEKKATTAQAHLKLAHEAMANGDRATYDSEYDAYIQQLNAESAKA